MAKKDCSELAQSINDAIMNIASRPDVKNLDDAITKYQKLVPGMTRQMVVDSIVEATEGTTGDPDSLAAKINRIKAEARTDKKLQSDIAELEAYIKAGAIPATKTRKQQTPPEAIAKLRDVRDGLKKQLAKSDPVRRARVQEQIKDLTARLKSGDIYPKPKAADPKSKELERLEFDRDELKRQIRRDIAELRPRSTFEKVTGLFDISRSVTLSFDFGAVFRQGGVRILSAPIQSAPALKSMIEATKSEKGLAKVDKAIDQHPLRPLFDRAKGFIAPTDGTYKPTKREEAHRSEWAEKHVPGVRMSNRAYVSFLNKLRIDMFSALVDSMGGDVTLEEARVLARAVNIATGRGELGKFESLAEFGAIPFLAPRWVVSRFQFLGGAFTTPIKALSGPERRAYRRVLIDVYAKYMIGFGILAVMLQMLGDMLGEEIDVELNPLSTNFGKARIKNTRIDLMSGIAQPTVLLSRVILGKTKTEKGITPIRPGRGVKELRAERDRLRSKLEDRLDPKVRKDTQDKLKDVKETLKAKDVPFNGMTTAKAIGQFTRYKFSPLVKFPFDLAAGTNAVGEPVTLASSAVDFVTPLSLRDVKESIEELGFPTGTAVSLAAILGAATNTYGFETRIRDYTISELQQEIEDNTYKRTSRSTDKETGEVIIRVKGQPHKGREYMVESLQKELDKRRKSGKVSKNTKKTEIDNVMNKFGINLG